MSRLAVLPAVVLTTPVEPPASQPEAWRLRLERLPDGTPFHRAKVFDAATGENVSRVFPAKVARRLSRSLETGHPVRIRLFRLNAQGHHYVDAPNHLASEVRWVSVVGWA